MATLPPDAPDLPVAALPSVLIADDEPSLRAALHTLLADEGYAVLEAEEGVAALEAITQSARPLLVLLDLVMPGMSGAEVLLRASADPCLMARHAYLVLTGAELAPAHLDPRMNPEVVTVLAAYDIPVVTKPFDLDELLAAVASQWRRLVPVQAGRKAANEGGSPGGTP